MAVVSYPFSRREKARLQCEKHPQGDLPMLLAKIRFVLLMARPLAALLAMSAGQSFTSIPHVHAQESAKPKARLKGLLEERALVTRELTKQVKVRFKQAKGTPDELIEPNRMALVDALDAGE